MNRILVSLAQAAVSMKRIRNFLNQKEIDCKMIEYGSILVNNDEKKIQMEESTAETAKESTENIAIMLDGAHFSWDDDMKLECLQNINVSFPFGAITMIIGRTGAGKSALIRAILGQVNKISGTIFYDQSIHSIGYTSQVPWIQNATVRDNILFGKKYEEDWYQKVVYACALTDDFELLPSGDSTEIGEKGINLSGGQKQRLSIARAVYSQSDAYIFDDPLSAVDSQVANHIFNECFINILQNDHKTVILATHSLSFLKFADNILMMNNGRIEAEGQLPHLISLDINLTQYIIPHNEDKNGEEKFILTKERTLSSVAGDSVFIVRQHSSKMEIVPGRSIISTIDDEKEAIENGQLIKDEEREIGSVSAKIYALYIHFQGGWKYFSLYITIDLAMLVGWMISYIWLATWTNAAEDSTESNSGDESFIENIFILPSNPSQYYFLQWYCIIQIIIFALYFGTNGVMLITRLKCSRELHKSLLHRLLHAPMTWFDTTPIGRIINRFAKDINTVDEALPSVFNGFIVTLNMLASMLIITCIVSPLFIFGLIVFAILFYILQKYYIVTARELKRISSILHSPIYSHFSETIDGLQIIRAFDKKSEFSKTIQDMIDADHQAYYATFMGNRLLGMFLDLMAASLVAFASLSTILLQYFYPISVGFVGLAVSSVLSVTYGLSMTMRYKADLEQNIVSIERINQYLKIEQEAPFINDEYIDDKWPSDGVIEFRNVFMRYRPHLDDVLRGISFTVESGQKVGIIGRTGAGKSSLFVSLLRLVENHSGTIFIDDVDISTIGLHSLRQRMSIIPQDPILFTGTVSFNLDPFGIHSEEELTNALKLSHSYSALKAMCIQMQMEKESSNEEIDATPMPVKSALDAIQFVDDEKYSEMDPLQLEVEENGNNFSVGQRQLLCLARAIVRSSKILLLDEATSAVDPVTDEMIQKTIRSEIFASNTILTIAHRIDTILDYDRILIVDNGIQVEFDSPANLLSNEHSRFSEIVQESFGVNLADVLKSKQLNP